MSYNFTNILEFRDFVKESFMRGDYAQEIENLAIGRAIGRNTTKYEERKWDFVEAGELYLVKSSSDNFSRSLYFMYRHPGEGFEHYIWYYYPENDKYSTWSYIMGNMAWVDEYLVIGSHSLSFMNWINENPFEVKQ